MSSTVSVKLTKEQEEFLNSLEEEFKDRYTDNDEEFKAVLNQELPLPPIVENYREFRQLDERGSNYRNDRDRNRDHYSSDERRFRYYYNDDSGRYLNSSRYVHRHRDQKYFPTYRPY